MREVGIEQANASQHLAVLRSKHIVETRKEGNQIFYRLRNPVVGDMLEMMRKYFFDHMNEAMEMLKQEKREATKAVHKEDKNEVLLFGAKKYSPWWCSNLFTKQRVVK